jgi:hypothetical protein
MSRWLKEPLLHFLILGGLIFYLYSLLADAGMAVDEIRVSRGQQENLINTFTRTWQRPPTAGEFKGLLDDYVRQEIAYREGQALGMDQDDIVIRRRMRQKLELLAEDVASLSVPSDEQLQAFLNDHPDDFQLEPRISLHHIYFSRDRRGEAAKEDAVALLQRIGHDGPEGDLAQFGDQLPLPFELDDMREGEIARLFGDRFTRDLQGVEAGKWAGPVRSGFGLHLVFVTERVDGRLPELAEVRDTVQREWFAQRRREAVEGLYDRLAENYSIEIEPLEGEEAPSDP